MVQAMSLSEAVAAAPVSSGYAAFQGDIRKVSVVMADLRGFTTVCERVPPGLMSRVLNEYLTAMIEVILGQQGRVQEYGRGLRRSRRITQAEQVRGRGRSRQHGGKTRGAEPQSGHGDRHKRGCFGPGAGTGRCRAPRIVCHARQEQYCGSIRVARNSTLTLADGTRSVPVPYGV